MASNKKIKKKIELDRRLVQFINFLKDNDAFNSFMYELAKQKSISLYPYISRFLSKNNTLVNVIDCAFTWCETEEGFEHWCSLSEEWDSFCYSGNVTYDEHYIIEHSYEISRF